MMSGNVRPKCVVIECDTMDGLWCVAFRCVSLRRVRQINEGARIIFGIVWYSILIETISGN